MRVLVTRPAEDGVQTALLLTAMGHQPLLAPLLMTQFFDPPLPALEDVQAILATSANGVRAFVRLSPRRDVPLFAVGPQTAEAAAAAGFSQVRNADGDARALAQAVMRWATPNKGALLHVSGEEGTGLLAELLTAAGFSCRKAVLYRVALAAQMPPEASSALQRRMVEAALFFSPRSASAFARLAARDKLSLEGVVALCISAATAAALKAEDGQALAFSALRVAAQPNQAALLARLAG
jgi:uroporphyrinogen-III synthase